MALKLVGITEIAEFLSVSRQRVYQLIEEDRSFPKPAAELSCGRVWLKKKVREWANEKGR